MAKYYSYDAALDKMQKYCAMQERCQSEIRSKLIEIKIYGEDLESIIAELITDNFLSEERYAKAFVRGKFRMNQWGKTKIKQALQLKKISPYCIKKGMEEITDEAYIETLKELLEKKKNILRETDSFQRNQKLLQYAISKGFESELIQKYLK
jgi:regulatory protein